MAKLISFGLLALGVATVFTFSDTTSSGCVPLETRPCYDKIKGGNVSVLKKNADNAFWACWDSAAPNEQGITTVMSSLCPNEQLSYAYCYEGKSRVYMRKFEGTCSPTSTPTPTFEPSPTPFPSPSSTPTPSVGPKPFRLLYPNGGETLPFGANFPARWEGGDPNWYMKIEVTHMGKMWGETLNDGYEDWIVDLPPGQYIMSARACDIPNCPEGSRVAGDNSDTSFTVTGGDPYHRITSGYPLNQPVVVLEPSGGESFAAGKQIVIFWSGGRDGNVINLKLVDYSGGFVAASIVDGTLNDGQYTWTIPATIPPGLYTIYVQCSTCEAYKGGYMYSFAPFTITAPIVP